MEERKPLIIAGIGAIIALLLLAALIYFLIKGFTGGFSTGSTVVTSSPTPAASSRPTTGGTTPSNLDNLKTITGPNFKMNYPKAWGILTCSNSSNFELDPGASQDMLQVACSQAQKPITVLVGNSNGCGGTTKQLGNNSVLYSKQTDSSGYIAYNWCTQNGPTVLNISERVSPNSDPATSIRDYSSDVEQMITSLKFGGGS